MPTVTFVQRIVPHYRAPFFKGLREELIRRGISLRLVFGQERSGTVPRTVPLDEPWAVRIRNRYLPFPGMELVWQPCLDAVSGSDLIIVEQANRLLVNYLLFGRRRSRGMKLAYFGHGRNLKAGAGSCRERFKARMLGMADWWFAYTRLSAETVARSGFSAGRITVVGNSADTGALRLALAGLDDSTVEAARGKAGVDGEPVALFCGGLYAEKRIGFLLEACEAIAGQVPGFQLVMVGDGPQRGVVEAAASRFRWLRYVGPRYGADTAPFFRMGRVLLMPGVVGLAITDSFAAGLPLVTTDIPGHGPEIAYLEEGVNGLVTRNSTSDYASAVAGLLLDSRRLGELRKGALRSAEAHSLESMVGSFADGIVRCLETVGCA